MALHLLLLFGRFFLQIEAVSLMTTEVRNTCEALKKKIATDTLSN